ncbi:hypothetical protein L8R23_03820 [Enterobacter roggenkampii]|nr:hypothetical protein [Enterobacter roggenkampii]
MPFSGVSKSGAGSIIHAGGSGGVTFAGCVELQPTLASSNIALKLIDSFLSICEFLCVFSVESGNVTLPFLHVGNGCFCQSGFVNRRVSLLLVVNGVITVVINSPS